MAIRYVMNPAYDQQALDALYAAAWPSHVTFDFRLVFERALVYIGAYDGRRLIGSVYVAWDGAQHAFLLEPTVHPEHQRRGIGSELVRRAATAARDAGCQVLHVDYEAALAPFYAACGFQPTQAGLIRLRD